MERPGEGANEGKTPALSGGQAKQLLNAPPADPLKGKRDRAILAVLLYHALRRDELCKVTVRRGRLTEREAVTADSDESVHLFRSIPNTSPTNPYSNRSEATLQVCG